jgi:nicotinate-nucleotide pyrophosphorylase (carboxylating)
VPNTFTQITWQEPLIDDCRQLIRLAVREDLANEGDLTTLSLAAPQTQASARIISRETGIASGLLAAILVADEMELSCHLDLRINDGDAIQPGTELAELHGSARDILTAERIMLNFIGRLSGIATLTRKFVDLVSHSHADIYDTRKTTPGWRRLEKYAVNCGGGVNHRSGLYEAVMIKDNHIQLAATDLDKPLTPAEALQKTRDFLSAYLPGRSHDIVLEIEVDTLDQLKVVLPANPDIVLLDNMSTAQLTEAVAIRDATNKGVVLEASGGVNIDTVKAISETGVDRISVGSLTHSAVNLDIGLDWTVEKKR